MSCNNSTTTTSASTTNSTSNVTNIVKLCTFPATYNSAAEILLHPSDFPGIQVGDIVEIYHPEDLSSSSAAALTAASSTNVNTAPIPNTATVLHHPRLLLKITEQSLSPENQKPTHKDSVFVEKSIAESFHLQNYKDVIVNKVNPEDVALDSVELTFKEQYLGRSEMWRLKKYLIGSCLFIKKKIVFCGGTIRCQVQEMWGQGIRLSCGVVTPDSKIVFRSPTAMIYLFIQMSSEMWDFNIHGDLYFEKAVDGFLSEMFDRWKSNGSVHEVTIVLFSRCFYDAEEKDQFPEQMKGCIQTGYNGSFYEDFYRVVVQNERFEDWNPILVQLRNMFTDYKRSILEYHVIGNEGLKIPTPSISNASQGNFLEVLNMSLNTFANHYQNRNLDRTGQQSIVITPGVGVFEVDRETTMITKQRLIDSGVGSDLICIGEQPLHAVPLLKFHSSSHGDDYSMPHYINLSFYNSKKKVGHSNFVPQIKLPPGIEESRAPYFPKSSSFKIMSSEDYDEYDRNVFARRSTSKKSGSGFTPKQQQHTNNRSSQSLNNSSIRRKSSDPDISSSSKNHASSSEIISSSLGGTALSSFFLRSKVEIPDPDEVERDSDFDHQRIKSYLLRPGLVLINPFDPSNTKKHVTSGRRRWTHTFSAWSSQLTTGVDWKSLTNPASLPITTDYIPERKDLENDFVFNEYNLNPDEINNADDTNTKSISRYKNEDLFDELVSQRLSQGFQIIVLPPDNEYSSLNQSCSGGGGGVSRLRVGKPSQTASKPAQEIWLSIGRLFHKVSLSANKQIINVTRFSPRTPYPNLKMSYHYRFQAPDNDRYEVSWVEFNTEKLENFNWNHMDYYVCTRGHKDYVLTEALKYWRFRTYVMNLTPYLAATKKIKDDETQYCDIYESVITNNNEGFLKFVENCLNGRQRRSANRNEPQAASTSSSSLSAASSASSTTTPSTASTSTSGVIKKGSGKQQESAPPPDDSHPILELLKTKLSFMNRCSLPNSTFVSAEAVQCLVEFGSMSDDQALESLELLRQEGLICHASGDTSIPVIHGFYLYYLTKDSSSGVTRPADLEAFQNEWIEIKMCKVPEAKGVTFLEQSIMRFRNSRSKHVYTKTVTFEVDPNGKSDRQEWGHLKYQSEYDSDSAFDISLLWAVATGAIIADLLHGWARKSQQQCGLSVIPVPADPFALPVTPNSDPVRGPIFIELNTEALDDDDDDYDEDDGNGVDEEDDFEEEEEFSAEQRLFLFRETIVRRFGFVPCASTENHQRSSSSLFSTRHKYIHCTGNMFLLIPTKLQLKTGIQGLRPNNSSVMDSYDSDEEPSSRIHRRISDKRPSYDHSKTGFLWSWNFMISKRWKQICNTGATGDIQFMDKMLADFRSFCRNDSNRLRDLWKDCWKKRNKRRKK